MNAFCVCACVCEEGESKATDCLSASALFINSWAMFYAFGDKV